ncbi:MAG TPA: hypothetical protein VM597_10780 [Gemmataceae bacterium]|nr:hypothetical protein [Gemmataceae bacterium]
MPGKAARQAAWTPAQSIVVVDPNTGLGSLDWKAGSSARRYSPQTPSVVRPRKTKPATAPVRRPHKRNPPLPTEHLWSPPHTGHGRARDASLNVSRARVR